MDRGEMWRTWRKEGTVESVLLGGEKMETLE